MKHIILTVNPEIQLKRFSVENAPELFAMSDKNRKYLSPWLPWAPMVKQVADSEKFINTSLEEMEEKKGLELGIWYQNKLVGCIGLHALSSSNRRASIGYWLDADFQGKGIMTQSVKALVNYCFTELDLNRLAIEAATENQPSYSIAERLGFAKEGVARQFAFINNRFLDYKLYSMLKSEWKL